MGIQKLEGGLGFSILPTKNYNKIHTKNILYINLISIKLILKKLPSSERYISAKVRFFIQPIIRNPPQLLHNIGASIVVLECFIPGLSLRGDGNCRIESHLESINKILQIFAVRSRWKSTPPTNWYPRSSVTQNRSNILVGKALFQTCSYCWGVLVRHGVMIAYRSRPALLAL